MATLVRPDPPSGAHRIPAPRSAPAAPPPAPAAPSRRLDHVDLLRGLVMVIMVLDHVRAYLTDAHFDPTDMARTDPALFGTRWITHFCAPIFVFLAGASAWIAGTRRTRGELAGFLASRGVWLILLEATLISFGWYFTTGFTMGVIAQVIWVIGASMVVLAGLIYLPRLAIAAFGLALVLGHNLLDGIAPERLGALAPLWHTLHVAGPLEIVPVFMLYPLVPWVGVMALGYVAGPLVFSRESGAGRRLAWTGALLMLAFVLLRSLDVYGDPAPRLAEGGAAVVTMSFLNLSKYPPSLLYLLMTLGPALVALPLLRRATGPLAGVLVTFGRVPFLFYVVHIYLVHALAVAAGVLQGYPASALRVVFLDLPEGFGFGLPMIYLFWLGIVAALYPLCRRYAALKGRSRAWWLSYL
ncbi:MAG TPA: heparan-alpha-glucosaminide N-acetyltransferase domain-containing protein [Gemmatimonadales bacterium]|nr:heparan-alpha-glucosaminide N-acetyltransferase domain-containing protein [Gemmatimonadales bacterium]